MYAELAGPCVLTCPVRREFLSLDPGSLQYGGRDRGRDQDVLIAQVGATLACYTVTEDREAAALVNSM